MSDGIKIYASRDWVEEKIIDCIQSNWEQQSNEIRNYVNENIVINDVDVKLPFSSEWLSVCYGNGKFIAVSIYDNKLAHSTDGIVWHKISMPLSRTFKKVIYAEDKFVALSGATILYSADGIDWVAVALPALTATNQSWSGLAYGNGIFVITAETSTASTLTSDVAYSYDCVNWVKTNLPLQASFPRVAYGNGKFITSPGGIAGGTQIYYSEDAINWNSVSIQRNSEMYSIRYVNDRFIADNGASDEGRIFIYSTDGLAWEKIVISSDLADKDEGFEFSYGNGVYVAVQRYTKTSYIDYNGTALYSFDGITWNKTTLPFKSSCSVTYGNGKFIALHNYYESIFAHSEIYTDTFMYSEDGINWHTTIQQLQTMGGENVVDNVVKIIKPHIGEVSANNEYQSIITGTPGQFVVIGNSGNVTTKNPYTYSQTDLEAGVSALETGKLYFVYE